MKNSRQLTRRTIAAVFATASLFSGPGTVVRPAVAQIAGYPDANNTGVPPGTSLTVVNGDMTVTANGAIIENKDIRGCITVNADNVIIRKSRVSCGGIGVIWSNRTNLLVEDVEIVCTGGVGTTGLTPRNYAARRVDARGCENIFWAESNVLIEDSYIHDTIPYNPQLDPHTDAIQMPIACNNITIRHNRVYGGYVDQSNFGSSAAATGHNCSNILIENNVFAGGGYSLRCSESGTGNTNYRVRNNRFSRIFVSTVGGFGPVNACNDSGRITEYSGNVYHETGQPLPGQSVATLPAPTNLRTVP